MQSCISVTITSIRVNKKVGAIIFWVNKNQFLLLELVMVSLIGFDFLFVCMSAKQRLKIINFGVEIESVLALTSKEIKMK